MALKNKYFIAIYTNEVKDYCDEKFFTWIDHIKEDNPAYVVDNTVGDNYYKRLEDLFKNFNNFNLYKLNINHRPERTQFLRNVEQSVNFLRHEFLKSNCDHFLIIESDVLPPEDLIAKLDKDIDRLEKIDIDNLFEYKEGDITPKLWGILGAHYYKGFHNYDETGIYTTHHALSGCTVYRRSLIEDYPFRWSRDNLGAFPDAWICYDAGKKYEIYNDGSIICEHLHADNGTRYSKSL